MGNALNRIEIKRENLYPSIFVVIASMCIEEMIDRLGNTLKKHPKTTFVAGQWDPAKVYPMAKNKLWIMVSEGDLIAFPGMNAITATLEKAGAKISRATWNGQSSAEEFASEVSKMVAEGSNINYTMFKKGIVVPAEMTDNGGSNHVCTWRIAYAIEGVRDWLFTHKK
jgi:predicted peptidase